VSLVERLRTLPKLKDYVEQQRWDYGEGYMIGTPETDEVIEYLYKQPVIPAEAIMEDGTINRNLIFEQCVKCFQWPRPESRYQGPLILIRQTDNFHAAYWEKHNLTYNSEVLGIALNGRSRVEHRLVYDRIMASRNLFRGWIALTSGKAGIQHATAVNKSDIDDCPFPVDEADLDLSPNDEIILNDAFDFYRDYQRLGDDADMMRAATPDDHREFARIFTRQINTVHKKMRGLPAKSWTGICCQPFVFGNAEPDWKDAGSLAEKLTALSHSKKSATLTTVRILRIFDGPFVFLIKPDRLRYWLRSIALRDADETLADLRGMGF